MGVAKLLHTHLKPCSGKRGWLNLQLKLQPKAERRGINARSHRPKHGPTPLADLLALRRALQSHTRCILLDLVRLHTLHYRARPRAALTGPTKATRDK